MNRTYAVHYGDGHLARCSVLAQDFSSLDAAKRAAKKLSEKYEIVIVADTDGNEWPMTPAAER